MDVRVRDVLFSEQRRVASKRVELLYQLAVRLSALRHYSGARLYDLILQPPLQVKATILLLAAAAEAKATAAAAAAAEEEEEEEEEEAKTTAAAAARVVLRLISSNCHGSRCPNAGTTHHSPLQLREYDARLSPRLLQP